MNLRHRMEKEPIELLLGLAGSVQYLEHTLRDEGTYWVRIKTKTGDKQIIIPVAAVQQIQFQKPSPAVIESIRKQLADETSNDTGTAYLPAEETLQPTFTLWRRFMTSLGLHK